MPFMECRLVGGRKARNRIAVVEFDPERNSALHDQKLAWHATVANNAPSDDNGR